LDGRVSEKTDEKTEHRVQFITKTMQQNTGSEIGNQLQAKLPGKTDKKRRHKVQFVAKPTEQNTGSEIGNQGQDELSVPLVTNMRKLPKSKCPPSPILEKGLIISGTFSTDGLKMKPSTLKSLCEGRCPYVVEPFVHLSAILRCCQNSQQTLNLRKSSVSPSGLFTKKDLVTTELAKFYFTESPKHKLNHSFVVNQALSKFIAIRIFDGEVRQDGDGSARIVFASKAASINCFLFTSFVHLAPVCPSFAVGFCKKRLVSDQVCESDECVELSFPGMKEVGASPSETSKCYLLKTQKKVYLAIIPKNHNSKAYFVDFALTGG